MEVHTIVNETSLKEAKKYLLPPVIKIFLPILIAFSALMVFKAIIYRSYIMAIFMLILTGFLIFDMIYVEKIQVKNRLKQLKEVYGKTEIEGYLVFRDSAVIVKNNASGGELSLYYSSIKKFIETEHQYNLFTNAWQLLIIDKAQFTPETQAEFLKLVAEKMPQLKIK